RVGHSRATERGGGPPRRPQRRCRRRGCDADRARARRRWAARSDRDAVSGSRRPVQCATMIPGDALREIARHARETYPAECCGLLLADASGALRFHAIKNVAGTAEGSATSGRTRQDGYVMDPKAVLQALEVADRSGGHLWGIV